MRARRFIVYTSYHISNYCVVKIDNQQQIELLFKMEIVILLGEMFSGSIVPSTMFL